MTLKSVMTNVTLFSVSLIVGTYAGLVCQKNKIKTFPRIIKYAKCRNMELEDNFKCRVN